MTPLGSTPRSFVRARGSDLSRGHGRKLRSYVFSRNGPDDEAIKPELENIVLYYTEAWRLSRYGDTVPCDSLSAKQTGSNVSQSEGWRQLGVDIISASPKPRLRFSRYDCGEVTFEVSKIINVQKRARVEAAATVSCWLRG